MKNITVIIPINNTNQFDLLQNAINNINSMEYDKNNIKVLVVLPKILDLPQIEGWDENNYQFISNTGKTDYCSQINFGVSKVETDYFSIMEVDDKYSVKWFNMFNNYIDINEDISVYLPINVIHNVKTNEYEYLNQIAWSTGFTSNDDNIDVAAMDKIGYITFNSLQDVASFNLTGGIFKTSDWLGYKSSIKIAFNYEYLLRATYKKQKVYVIPKEGYYHMLLRDDSLTEQYINEISEEDSYKWFELAKREYYFDEDRNKDIINDIKEELK